MHLQDVQNHLPVRFQDSNLPWTPLQDDQAITPRAGDGWNPSIPGCPVEIDYDSTLCGTLYYAVRVINTSSDLEFNYAEFEELQNAVTYAEKTLETSSKPVFSTTPGRKGSLTPPKKLETTHSRTQNLPDLGSCSR